MKQEDVALTIIDYVVAIIYNVIENQLQDHWSSTRIYIYDPDKKIKDEEIISIIEYLYAEGFILDRRTSYEIVERIL